MKQGKGEAVIDHPRACGRIFKFPSRADAVIPHEGNQKKRISEPGSEGDKYIATYVNKRCQHLRVLLVLW